MKREKKASFRSSLPVFRAGSSGAGSSQAEMDGPFLDLADGRIAVRVEEVVLLPAAA